MAIEDAGHDPISPFNNGIGYDPRPANDDPAKFVATVSGNKADSKEEANAGVQLVPYAFSKEAIMDIREYQLFQQLATSREQPKYSGKQIKMYKYYPVIDDRNINDQGIDANGLVVANGNLWGSSRDPGVIKSKMPVVGEFGGRINRIGFTRGIIKGEMKKFGFAFEYSEDEMNFDSDVSLYRHITALAVEAGNKIMENLIQLDLKDHAGIKMYGGDKTNKDDLDETCQLSYELFSQLNQSANKNRVPTDTVMIKGSTKTDTRVISSARILYVPDELMPDIERIKNFHNEQAFIEVAQYASAGNVLRGEIGKIGHFRIISVQEMQLEGESTKDATEGFYAGPNGKFQVFPLVMVGKDSFNSMSFHGGNYGKYKWKIISKKPGLQTADRHDFFGENGFWSLKFFYGFISQRPERIAKVLVTAKI